MNYYDAGRQLICAGDLPTMKTIPGGSILYPCYAAYSFILMLDFLRSFLPSSIIYYGCDKVSAILISVASWTEPEES